MKKNTRSLTDYLVIGHITLDVYESGKTPGGTAAYSTLTAKSLGRIPGIITSHNLRSQISVLNGIQTYAKPSNFTTRFKNIETPTGRKQHLLSVADCITPKDISSSLKETKLIHFGPVADEIDPEIIEVFPTSFIGLTPQGWMRKRDENAVVHYKPWESADYLLPRCNAVVISIEDILGNEELIQDYARKTEVLVVTEGEIGARIYWRGDVRYISAPKVNVVDATGAGDIFAAVFFDHLEKTKKPWISGHIAVHLASNSVTRSGLSGVPTIEEIRSFQIEVFEGK